jgi:hypothetical protein
VRYLLTALVAVVICVAACNDSSDTQTPTSPLIIPAPGVILSFGVPMSENDVASFARRNNLLLELVYETGRPPRLRYRFLINRKVVPLDSTEAEIASYLKQAYPDTIDNIIPDPNPEG